MYLPTKQLSMQSVAKLIKLFLNKHAFQRKSRKREAPTLQIPNSSDF
jgi:hypothetical protein